MKTTATNSYSFRRINSTLNVGFSNCSAAGVKFSRRRLAAIALHRRITCLYGRRVFAVRSTNYDLNKRNVRRRDRSAGKETNSRSFGKILQDKLKLDLLKQSLEVKVSSADERFLLKLKETILSRLNDEQLSVESLATEIGSSPSQLFRRVTALTGMSTNELIRTFRLQKAAQLLEQDWGAVKEVAYEVGFSNLSYFSKVFKEECGVRPSEYRTRPNQCKPAMSFTMQPGGEWPGGLRLGAQ